MSEATTDGTRILTRGDRGTALVRKRCRLEVLAGPDASRVLELEGLSVRVGSEPGMDLLLADPSVSGAHFELSAGELGWRLRDLGSTNGTFVGGLRCAEVWLRDGAEIRLGETRLAFHVEADDVELSLSRRTNFGALLGHSSAMRAAFAMLERAAKTESTVLVLGESGTGKELAARGVHEASARAEGPYVVFDCGAVAPTLLESQLFGHARGAFTGATDARPGVFEEADGGTLVLDEIGELPLELQPKLLRALEQRQVTRVGESGARQLDVRFVACTNRPLREEVLAGRFREDLYFRLSVLTVRLPPLRDRVEEIPRLVASFLDKLGAETELAPSVMRALLAHRWPGNVRELRNVTERMVAMADLGVSAWLPDAGTQSAEAQTGSGSDDQRWDAPFHDAKQQWVDAFERTYLERLFERHAGNVSEAARAAGLSRQSCYRLMRKHGLDAAQD